MHYYQFNIGDYSSHTSHLDPMEDIAYRRMLDWCYLHEIPLPESVEEIARTIRMRSECQSIELILKEYFKLTKDGYVSERCDKEIKKANKITRERKKAAKARWGKKGAASSSDASAMQVDSKRTPSDIQKECDTEHITQDTVNNKRKRFTPPTVEMVSSYCSERSNTVNPESFMNHYQSNGWNVGKNKMKDWQAAVRTWESNNEQRTNQLNHKQSRSDGIRAATLSTEF